MNDSLLTADDTEFSLLNNDLTGLDLTYGELEGDVADLPCSGRHIDDGSLGIIP